MEFSLAALRPGQTGIVLPPPERSSDCGNGLAVRLRDLGFTAGTPVTCLLTAPLGDPSAYRIRGTTVALRHTDASGVKVELLPQTSAMPTETVPSARGTVLPASETAEGSETREAES